MKILTKSISSPVRTDEFTPPLIRFPRSKSSRTSRSRSNPMFVRKINDTNNEPSSPKVTCIGQVRVKRSNNNKKQTQTTTTGTTAVRWSNWLRKLNPKWFRRVWRKIVSLSRCNCCRKPENLQEAKPIEANQINDYGGREIGAENDVSISDLPPRNALLITESKQIEAKQITEHRKREIGAEFDDLISESPPRNAFLLTRSRSAPYRSYYADSFSKSTIENTEDEETGKRVEEIEGFYGDIGKENGENDGSINGVEEFIANPLNLSRCKSEPARTGDKLSMSFSP